MAQGTKITLSGAELEAVTHPDFFYIKHSAMNKVMEVMGETERVLREIILHQPRLDKLTNIKEPKIFRGENYRRLPYMVLDFPRHFSSKSIFAYRSMFWWGKEFSFTLHLQGEALVELRKSIQAGLPRLTGKEYYACVNDKPWQYYFEDDNYLKLDLMADDKRKIDALFEKDFLKLSRRLPIENYQQVPGFAGITLRELLEIVF